MPTLRQQLTAARALTDNPVVVSKLDVIDVTLTAALEHAGATARFLDRAHLPQLGQVGTAHASAGVFAGGVELRPASIRSSAWVVVSLDRPASEVDCSVGTTVLDADDLPAVALLEAWLRGTSTVTL